MCVGVLIMYICLVLSGLFKMEDNSLYSLLDIVSNNILLSLTCVCVFYLFLSVCVNIFFFLSLHHQCIALLAFVYFVCVKLSINEFIAKHTDYIYKEEERNAQFWWQFLFTINPLNLIENVI